MNPLTMLNKSYSTTRLLYKFLKDKFLDDSGIVKKEYKFKINDKGLNIIDSKIVSVSDDKLETYLFLPEREKRQKRQGEGGLRTKGFLKFSYRKLIKEKVGFKESKNGDWYAVDLEGNPIFKVKFPSKILIDLEERGITYLPLITVITVVLNTERELEKTINSVLQQTYPNVEYIIIDGVSKDGTLDIIRKYEDYIDYWVSEKDNGTYDAMNKGVYLANGSWINFMNAGDKFYNNKVLEEIFLNKKCIADVIYGDTEVIKDNKFKKLLKAKDIKNSMDDMPTSHQSFFIKGSIHKKNLYNTDFIVAADFDLIFKLWNLKKSFYYTNSTISIMGSNNDSISVKKADIAMFECFKITGKKKFILKSYLAKIKKLIKKFKFSEYIYMLMGYRRIK